MTHHNREHQDRDRDAQRQSDFDYDRSRSSREQEREWTREPGDRGQEFGAYGGQGERGRPSGRQPGGGYPPSGRGEWTREQGRGYEEQGRGGWEREGRGSESQEWGEQGYGQRRGWQREGRGFQQERGWEQGGVGEQGRERAHGGQRGGQQGDESREYGRMGEMPRGEFDYAAGGQGFPRSGRESGFGMGWQQGRQFSGQFPGQFGGGQYGGSPFGGSQYPGGGQAGEEMGRGPHAGRGPKGYKRSDDRIREDVCERLSEHPYLDASEIEVKLQGGEVTLTGTIESRHAKRLAEDVVEQVSGVKEVHNQLRLRDPQGGQGGTHGTTGQSGRSVGKE
jgi:hypothetical protein